MCTASEMTSCRHARLATTRGESRRIAVTRRGDAAGATFPALAPIPHLDDEIDVIDVIELDEDEPRRSRPSRPPSPPQRWTPST